MGKRLVLTVENVTDLQVDTLVTVLWQINVEEYNIDVYKTPETE